MKDRLLEPLNEILGEQSIFLRYPKSRIHLICAYSECPFKYIYKCDDKLEKITSISQNKHAYHSVRAHRNQMV